MWSSCDCHFSLQFMLRGQTALVRTILWRMIRGDGPNREWVRSWRVRTLSSWRLSLLLLLIRMSSLAVFHSRLSILSSLSLSLEEAHTHMCIILALFSLPLHFTLSLPLRSILVCTCWSLDPMAVVRALYSEYSADYGRSTLGNWPNPIPQQCFIFHKGVLIMAIWFL